MKKSTENTFIISTLILCLLIFAGGFLYTRVKSPQKELIVHPSKTELRLIIDNYIQSQQYDEALDYLGNFKKTEDSKLLGLINYYLAKVEYERLNYLSNESKWEQYHRYKKTYLHNILKETDIVLINLPETKYALYAQYLRYGVYNLLYIDVKRDKAFETFKDMLDDYCQSNKEYATVKEYALTLYKDNKIQKAKQLNNIYIKYLKQYLSEDEVKYKLKSYADAVFNQEKYHAAKDIYNEYLELELRGEDELGAQLALKDIIVKYLEQGQFYPAKEFAELAINKYPDSYLSDYFQLKLAQCYFEMEYIDQAKETYYKILDEYPYSGYRQETITTLAEGIMIYSFKNPEFAIEEIEGLKEYTSNAKTKSYLLVCIADIYFLDKQYKKAKEVYSNISDKYPNITSISDIKEQIEKCKEKLKN